MKKYITTDKHPELKEGIILFINGDELISENATVEIHNEDECVEEGYIKEVEENAFTKDDMLDFVIWFDEHIQGYEEYDDYFNGWLQERTKDHRI